MADVNFAHELVQDCLWVDAVFEEKLGTAACVANVFNASELVENGFFEKEINRVTNTFGNITQVFSTYESFRSESDEKPFMRGINSIQLLNDGDRWWIINIYWTQESKENPIPDEYLPKS